MVKQRMGSVDVAGEVACLKQRVVGLRLANLYDLNPKTYVLKLAKSGSEGEKVFLLLESGSRFHTVQVIRDKPDAPSNFCLKLRKHLRTRRLEDVRQLGVDRVVDFTFGAGESAYHLILEMYAQGNVILTNHKYEVLTLLRSHRDDDKGLAIMARHPYPMQHVRLRVPLQLAQVHEALAEAANPQPAPDAAGGGADATVGADVAGGKKGASGGGKGGDKGGDKGGLINLKGVISGLLPYGPGIAEHVVLTAGLDPLRVPGRQPLGGDEVAALFGGVQKLEAWFAGLELGAPAGFIAAARAGGPSRRQRQKAAAAAAAAAAGGAAAAEGAPAAAGPAAGDASAAPADAAAAPAGMAAGPADAPAAAGAAGGDAAAAAAAAAAAGAAVVYEDFNPLRLAQSGGDEVIEFEVFDDALDEFYSKIEGQRVDVAKADAEKAAVSKLERVRQDQGARLAGLEAEATEAELRATLIEYNLGEVDAAINAVNAAIASGMDWQELETMIREERRAGNPVAGLIHSLQLDSNRVTLLLQNNLDEEDDSEEAMTRPATKVPVDLALSAYANARQHHEARKRQLQKRDKTLAANEAALRAAEKKAAAQLANLRNNAATAQVVRKAAWYERFHWFVSSENYLIISGRDAQQNELIVKRYFRKGDAYVHAELHGASSTVVRNNDPSKPVPPLTLQQAGCACVCRSRAWEQKVVTSAYWVHHHQVSKAAPTGEYLPTGSFMIRGKKNYLPPQPLVFGFGFMFKLEESCIGHHVGERAVRGGLDGEEDEAAAAAFARYGTGGAAGGAAPGEGAGGDEDEGDDEGASALLGSASEAASALDRFMEGSVDVLGSGASFKRYGLGGGGGSGGGADGGGSGGSGAPRGGDGKARISAAERAAAKKAGKTPAAAPGGGGAKGGGGGGKGQGPQKPPPAPAGGKGGAAAAAAAAALATEAVARAAARGKKGKGGKKDKYADQDEEDRALALALLGSAGQKKTKTQRRDERKAKREAKRQGGLPGAPAAEDMEEAIRKATGRQFADAGAGGAAAGEDEGSGSSGSGSESGDEARNDAAAAAEAAEQEGPPAGGDAAAAGPEEASAAEAAAAAEPAAAAAADDAAGDAEGEEQIGGSEGGDGGDDDLDEAALLAAAANEAEAAEISALLAEENVAEADYGDTDAGAAQALRELDSLTGQPRADDILLHAVCVCGPYSALTAYKYKVKLVPGTLKKGKATRAALDALTRGGDASTRERELMRAVPEADMVNAMVGTVKISLPGLQKLKAEGKKAKKAAAQARAGGKGS